MKNNKPFDLVTTALSLTSILLLSKIISFLRDMFLAQGLGATYYSDVFLVSNSIIMFFVSFILSPFAAAYIPIAMDYYLGKDKLSKEKFLGTVYGMAICLGILVTVIQGLFIEQIVRLITPGFDEEAIKLLVKISYIQLPVIFFTFIFAVNNGNLRMINKFNIAVITNIFVPLGCIFYLIVEMKNPSVEFLSICVVLGYVFSFIIQVFVIAKSDLRPKINFNFLNNSYLKKIALAMGPFMIAGVARQLNSLVDKSIGSLLNEGSITILSYANKITTTQVGLISTAISLVVFSQMSRLNTLNDKVGLHDTIVDAIKLVNMLIIPISILTIVLRIDIVTILFGRGAFNENNIKMTADTMMIYSIGMFGFGMQDVLMRGMHATKFRKFPALVSVGMVAINILLDLLLYEKWGTCGLAAATSIAVLLTIPILYIFLDKKVVSIKKEDNILKDTGNLMIAGLIMGAVSYGVDTKVLEITGSNLLALISSALVGVFIYLICLVFMKNDIAINIMKRRK